MPTKTPCKYCGRVGFVRAEHVISHGKAQLHYYCGFCERTWEVDEVAPEKEIKGRKRPTRKD